MTGENGLDYLFDRLERRLDSIDRKYAAGGMKLCRAELAEELVGIET